MKNHIYELEELKHDVHHLKLTLDAIHAQLRQRSIPSTVVTDINVAAKIVNELEATLDLWRKKDNAS